MAKFLIHLVRGAAEIACILGALSIASPQPLISLLLFAAALLLLRGCPLCWLFGLCEIVRPPAAPPSPK